jgi:predicted AAA+ superfamily ATPase
MKRSLEEKLVEWKSKEKRKPLIVNGARQVGKTYLVESFGSKYFERVITVDFKEDIDVHKIFKNGLNSKKIINELSIYLGIDIDIDRDLIFFDEIQNCPEALTGLKYFYKYFPKAYICCAGSLLGLGLNPGDFPVGKIQTVNLYPISFTEFLISLGEDRLVNHLKSNSFSEAIHKKTWEFLKIFFVIGGLPEVITTYIEHMDRPNQAYTKCRELQKELLDNYMNDIAKHSGKLKSVRIEAVFKSVPAQLAKEKRSKKFNFKGVLENNSKYSYLEGPIEWLVKAGLIYKVPICNKASSPLLAYTENNTFALYLFDIGILGAMNNLSYRSILNYDYGSYKGYFAENFVLNELISATEHEIFSWKEKQSQLEFIIDLEGSIIPIEVKSGVNIRARSLIEYRKRYNPKQSYILSGRHLMDDKGITYLPLYLAKIIGRK